MELVEVRDYIGENFISFLPEQYKDYKVSFNKTYKTNREVEGFTIRNPENLDRVTPTLYVEDVFESYREGKDIDEVLKQRAEIVVDAMGREPRELVTSVMNLEHLKNNVIFSVVNARENSEMLKNCPHRLFEDLAITYCWIIAGNSEGIYSNRINNDLCEKFGINEEYLYEMAQENTLKLMPIKIKSMNDVIGDIMFGDDIKTDPELKQEFDEFMEDIPDERSMYVITNSINMYGSNALLFPEEIADLADKFESDLYILPSSTHELIAISSKSGTAEELAEMVYEVNMSEVSVEDRLSNEVYFYDRDKREIYRATDVPNKSLSNKAADRNISYEAHKPPVR